MTRSFTPARQGGPPQFDAGISFPIDWLVFGKRSAAMDSARLNTEQYRPDIVATRLKITQSEADVRLEERKALPQITPSAGYTRQFQEKAIGFPDANSWGVGIAVSVPIFDRNQGGISKANSLLVQSRYNLQDQLVQLRNEVAQAAENFKLAQTFVKSDTALRIAAAKSVRDRIEMAYKEGGRNLLEMLDAQRTYRDIARSTTTDQAAYWKALHRLNAAIGKQILK